MFNIPMHFGKVLYTQFKKKEIGTKLAHMIFFEMRHVFLPN